MSYVYLFCPNSWVIAVVFNTFVPQAQNFTFKKTQAKTLRLMSSNYP
jgi:hypothetical protein